MSITDAEVKNIEAKAKAIRETIIEMLVAAKSGHTAGPLGMADIFAALYFHVLKHDQKNPDWAERDRLFLSNGHICPVLYSTMAHAGYFPIEECMTLRKFGARLQGHPERDMLPGLESTSGPLGSGLSQATGYALAARIPVKESSDSHGAGDRNFRVYCITSDGEHQEGNTWEAIMFAGKYRLSNLIQIMDRNNIQIDGRTEDIMPLEPLADKYRAFNWHVIEIDGHNIREFVAACDEAHTIQEKPTLILAHTIPGKGVPQIENDYRWHGGGPGRGVPSAEQKEPFLEAIKKTYA
ncbi:transketolase [Candidatus Kaiserbacteria bacterium]|nr:transketolase [Candidatus Kaiserbacteria bacterium]